MGHVVARNRSWPHKANDHRSTNKHRQMMLREKKIKAKTKQQKWDKTIQILEWSERQYCQRRKKNNLYRKKNSNTPTKKFYIQILMNFPLH